MGGLGNDTCVIGNIGALCESCDLYNVRNQGHFTRNSKYSCWNCTEISSNILIIISLITFIILSMVLSIKSTLRIAEIRFQKLVLNKIYDKDNYFDIQDCNLASIYIKLLITYFQIISTLTSLEIKTPEGLEIIDGIGNPLERFLYSFDCFIVSIIVKINIVYLRLIIGIIFPFVLFFSFAIVFLMFQYVIKKDKKKNFVLYSVMLFLFIYIQPNLIEKMLAILSCRKISNNLYMKADTANLCYSAQHIFYIIVLVSPAAIILGFLFPICLYLFLFKRRKKLNMNYYLKRFGFLYNEYKPKYFYWELVKIYFKLSIFFSLNYYDSYIKVKACLILIFLSGYFFALNKCKPYKTDSLIEIDKMSIIFSFFTILIGMIAFQAEYKSLPYICFIVIGLINFFFLQFMIRKIINTLSETLEIKIEKFKAVIVKKIPFLKKILKVKKISKFENQWKKLRKHVFSSKFLKKNVGSNLQEFIFDNKRKSRYFSRLRNSFLDINKDEFNVNEKDEDESNFSGKSKEDEGKEKEKEEIEKKKKKFKNTGNNNFFFKTNLELLIILIFK